MRAFVHDYLGKTLLHCPGDAGRFADLFSWHDLNSILNYQDLVRVGRVKLFKSGVQLAQGRFIRTRIHRRSPHPYLLTSAVANALRDGATLIVDGVDEMCGPVSALAEDVERAVLARVSVNLYAAWGGACGFDVHYDDHEVLIVQVVGFKHWKIYGPSVRFPVDRQQSGVTMEANRDPLWEGILNCGEALYVPRGWWHEVSPCNAETLHLTLGFRLPTGIDMLEWLLSTQLKQCESMREGVPLSDIPETQASYARSFCDTVSQICGQPDVMNHFSEYLSAVADTRPRFCLPWNALADALCEGNENLQIGSALSRPVEIKMAPDGRTIELSLNGQLYRYGVEAKLLIEFIDARRRVVWSEVKETFKWTFDDAQLRDLTNQLIQDGVFHFDN